MKCNVCKKKLGLFESRSLWYGKPVCRKCGKKLLNAGKMIMKKEIETDSLGWLIFLLIVIPPIGAIWLFIMWCQGKVIVREKDIETIRKLTSNS